MISKLTRNLIIIIYARFSTEMQAQSLSIEGQVRTCREFIKRQWPDDRTEIKVITDEGVSGKLRSRPGYDEVKEHVRRGEAKYIVVDKYERLGRGGPDTELDIRWMEGKSVEVWSTKETRDPFIRPLIGLVSEKRLRDDADNTLRGMRALAHEGFPPGGPVNFGWKRKRIDDPLGKKDREGELIKRTIYKIVAEEAAVIRRIFRLYDEGVGLTTIAKTLNRTKAPAPRGGKHGWAPASVRSILLNKKYAGFLIFDRRHFRLSEKQTRIFRAKPADQWIEVESPYVPAIVGLDLWTRVNARFESRRGTGPSGPSATYPLTGIVTCAVCGNACSVVSNKRKGHTYRYIRCGTSAKRGTTICNNRSYVSHDESLTAVVEGLERHLFSEKNVAYLVSRVRRLMKDMLAGSGSEFDALKHQLAGVERKIAGLVAYVEEHGAADPEIPDQLRKRRLERDQLKLELKSLAAATPTTSSVSNLDSKIRGLVGKTLKLLTSETAQIFREELSKHIEVAELHPDKRIRIVGTAAGLLRGADIVPSKMVAGGCYSPCTDSLTFEFWIHPKGAAA